MKLITEWTDIGLDYITEDDGNGGKNLFIEGVFMQANVKNRNRRVYEDAVLKESVAYYVDRQVSKKRAVGELNHPDSPKINLDKVSHAINELRWDGNDVIGKAKILETPMGKIARQLMEGGVQLGVSSRGMGHVSNRRGTGYVDRGFVLTAVDIVQDPSAPSAFVNGIMEGVEFIKEGDDWKPIASTQQQLDRFCTFMEEVKEGFYAKIKK